VSSTSCTNAIFLLIIISQETMMAKVHPRLTVWWRWWWLWLFLAVHSFQSLLLFHLGHNNIILVAALNEEERLVEYEKRNYTWPIKSYVPNTTGWRHLMEHRFQQLAQISNHGERYEGYIQLLHSAILVPNFTEYGFGLAKCPDALTAILQDAIRQGLPTAQHERKIEVIDAPQQPLFIHRPDLTARVLHELLPYAEAWSGIELAPYTAYGFRLYQNHSQLTMHVDKVQTHIISFILHIDAAANVEPWPIVMEDFHGVTHEVILTPGDILFYESSKCFHGRPRRLNGLWYSSLFVHYYPKHGWYEQDHKMEAHYAVPPIWSDEPSSSSVSDSSDNTAVIPRLQMVGTSLKEPDCTDDWCGLATAQRWNYGPGRHGYWLTPYGEARPLLLQKTTTTATVSTTDDDRSSSTTTTTSDEL
jgi:hypothetical protein